MSSEDQKPDPSGAQRDKHSANNLVAGIEKRELLPLPGLAAISLYLLVLGGVIILGAAGGHYPPIFLLLAAAFLASSAGLFLLLRWAWAMALSAAVLLACYYFWIFTVQHMGPAIIQGLLNLVFFLYLIRPDVRSKLR